MAVGSVQGVRICVVCMGLPEQTHEQCHLFISLGATHDTLYSVSTNTICYVSKYYALYLYRGRARFVSLISFSPDEPSINMQWWSLGVFPLLMCNPSRSRRK